MNTPAVGIGARHKTVIEVRITNPVEVRPEAETCYVEPVKNTVCILVAQPLTKQSAVGGYPKVAFNDLKGEQLHYPNLAKYR